VSGEAEAFTRVDVIPDTPAWEAERRLTLGASEIPAVLGLSPYATPLDVYRAKFGADRAIDPELAFIGHAEEVVIGKWLRAFHPELGVIRRGFMARSTTHPFLHASFDRFVVRARRWRPVQMKTAHQYASDAWDDEQVPLAVQAQIQAELLVHGTARGYAVAFIGGRRFQLVPVDRDEEFLRDVLIPQAERFWTEHVLAEVPPDPTTPAEAASLWSGADPEPLFADELVLDLVAALRDAQTRVRSTDALVDSLKLAIQTRMREHIELVDPMGDRLATWKPTAGARRLDTKALRADHPDLAAEYTRQAAPGRQFRVIPAKETPDE
jgi:putative phage-type endonuclease